MLKNEWGEAKKERFGTVEKSLKVLPTIGIDLHIVCMEVEEDKQASGNFSVSGNVST